MKARRAILAASALFGLLAGCGTSTTQPLPDLGGREVKIAMITSYPPFNDVDPATGEAAGWDYDMMAELSRRLNFTPVYAVVPFAGIIDGVAAGTYDMAGGGITITYQRAQRVDFSRQYMIVRQRLVVRAGESRFATLVDAKLDPALRVGAETNSTNYDAAVAYFGESRVTACDGFEAAITGLLDGTLDIVVADDVAYHAQRELHPGELSRLPGVLYGDLLGFPFPKNSELIDPVNRALDAMEKDGTLQALGDKWIVLEE